MTECTLLSLFLFLLLLLFLLSYSTKCDISGGAVGSQWSRSGVAVGSQCFFLVFFFLFLTQVIEVGSQWGRSGVAVGSQWSRSGVAVLLFFLVSLFNSSFGLM